MDIKDKVVSILEKDINKRYIAVSSLQADGRLHLDQTCINILAPKENEEFFILNDNNSVIITRSMDSAHNNKLISTIKYGSGKNSIKWRLRIPQVPLRKLLSTKVGFRAFKYNGQIAISAEPYLDSNYLNSLSSIDDLTTFLTEGNKIIHIECVTYKQNVISNVKFRLLGEYWKTSYHLDPFDSGFNFINCNGYSCKYCKKKYIIAKSIYWFPVVAYHNNGSAIPALLSFKLPNIYDICEPLVNECDSWNSGNKYHANGTTNYDGNNIWSISSKNGILSVDYVRSDNGLTVEEKGLMKIAYKEINDYISNFEKNNIAV